MPIQIVADNRYPPARVTDSGTTYYSEHTVIAASQDDARAKLASERGIQRGTPFVDEQGGIPDVLAVALEFHVAPSVHAIDGGEGLYTVTVSYFYESLAGIDPQPQPGGPTKWSIRRSIVTEPADVDVAGQPIQNSAGQPFLPPASVRKIERTLVGTRLVYATSELAAQAPYLPYEGTCNSATYKGAPRGSFWLNPVEVYLVSGDLNDPGVKVWQVTVAFDYRPPRTLGVGVAPFKVDVEGWQTVRPNFGTRIRKPYFGGPTYRLYKIRDGQGAEIDAPVMLHPSGEDYYRNAGPGDTNYKVFTHYAYTNFAAIPI